MTLLQELEYGRLIQTPMQEFPDELKEALTGQIVCMDVICETVKAYVTKTYPPDTAW